MQLGWSLPFAWALIWTAITIPWVQSDLRREKKAWAENRGQGGIPWTDDITAPTARTRFASVHARLPLPWREKQSAPSTPSVESAQCADGALHVRQDGADDAAAALEGKSENNPPNDTGVPNGDEGKTEGASHDATTTTTTDQGESSTLKT